MVLVVFEVELASECLWAEIALKYFGLQQRLRPNKLMCLTFSTSPHAKTILFLYDSIDFASVLEANAPSWTPTDFGAIVAKRGPELRQ